MQETEVRDVFTDEVLSSRRTTRREFDPLVDRKDSLVKGDLILVDTSAYREDGRVEWITFLFDSPGSASVYPYKGKVPERGVGQWRASEILAWARPIELHERLKDEALRNVE